MTATSLMTENPLFKSIGQIFHPLFVAVADTLAFIYGLIPNYAIAIILLTILIMLLLTPLTVKSTRSMIAMQSLQPEMQKLRAKYKGAENREVLNQELMKLYKEHGVNPMGGCLPMFLQMPFLIVLYDVIRGLSNTTKTKNVVTTCAQYLSGSTHFLTNAQPRYIPNTSKMYCNLVQSGGAMKAFGMNLALKPLSHHPTWYAYIPYLILVAAAVTLQFIQMNQMTKRNPAAAQANPQMQKMQKIMPLIFAYIYFIIPAGVVIYMIVSTLIRIGTQDVIFRTGLVKRPAERTVGAGSGRPLPAGGAAALTEGDGGKTAPKTAPKTSGNGKPTAAKSTNGKSADGATAGGKTAGAAPTSQGSTGGKKPSTGQAKSSGSARSTNGSSGSATEDDSDTSKPKPHPRSKSKRDRRAR